MSDIKISQLNSTNDLLNTDILPLSRDIGGGKWESKSIDGLSVLHALTAGRQLTVAKAGTIDASTIKDACLLAATMSPSELNPISIQVYTGHYEEENPIIIPRWVSLYAMGEGIGVSVEAKNNGIIFQSSGNCSINGLRILGNVLFSNIGFKSSTNLSSTIRNCTFEDLSIGILADAGRIVSDFNTGNSILKTFDKFISSINGSEIDCISNQVYSSLSVSNIAFNAENSSSIHMWDCHAEDCTNGIYSNNIGNIDCFSGHFEYCVNAVHIGPIGASNVKCVSTVIEDSISKDLVVESTTAHLSYVGAFNSSKFSIVDGATISSQANDANTGGGLSIGQTTSWASMNIGTAGALYLGKDVNVNIGEGSSFVNDQYGNPIVEYWQYNENAPSGSRFTRFANNSGTQLTGANDAIIVGCKYPFSAIRIDVDVALITANYITTEYWNGATWVDVSSGVSGGGVAGYRRSDYKTRANLIFRNVEAQYVEVSSIVNSNGDWSNDYDIMDEIPKWDSREDFYAIRFRNNGVLTSGMTFTHGMIKPNSFVISTSGHKANFGLYRTDKSLYIDSISFTPDKISPPSYTTIQVSPNIDYGVVPVFLKANAVSKVAVAFLLPHDIDTASPLQCFIDGTAVNAGSGDIASTVYIASIHADDPPPSFPIADTEIGPQITTVPGGANAFVTIIQDIDISEMHPDDLLFVSFARTASDPSDTYNGDLIVGDITFRYKGKFV